MPDPDRHQSYDDEAFVEFAPAELYWASKQHLLHSNGYDLRPRFRPGWIPSWRLDPTVDLYDAEDHLTFHPAQTHLMDARRISDGKLVLVKKVARDSREVRIASFFSSTELRSDTRNHCVPILDVLDDPEDPAISFLVMPFLRNIDDPEFDTVGSILECAGQLLEGLVFMHEHHVAHRDCAYRNILMDATAIYPEGFHPIADLCLPDNVIKPAPVLPRSAVPVTYYYVDFGISTLFSPDDTDRLVTGMSGLDRDVPELSKDMPYDPFKVDVFILGNLLRKSFVEKYANVGMLAPLASRMTAQNPAERPNAVEALQYFRQISEGVWTVHRLWRAQLREEPYAARPVLDIFAMVSAAYRTIF